MASWISVEFIHSDRGYSRISLCMQFSFQFRWWLTVFYAPACFRMPRGYITFLWSTWWVVHCWTQSWTWGSRCVNPDAIYLDYLIEFVSLSSFGASHSLKPFFLFFVFLYCNVLFCFFLPLRPVSIFIYTPGNLWCRVNILRHWKLWATT